MSNDIDKIPFPKPGEAIWYKEGQTIERLTDGQITWFIRKEE